MFFNVSTHSRLKAAGFGQSIKKNNEQVSTHSRLKAAGIRHRRLAGRQSVSTHSRLKAAGQAPHRRPPTHKWFQHTAA